MSYLWTNRLHQKWYHKPFQESIQVELIDSKVVYKLKGQVYTVSISKETKYLDIHEFKRIIHLFGIKMSDNNVTKQNRKSSVYNCADEPTSHKIFEK